jgi:hypothetical protein
VVLRDILQSHWRRWTAYSANQRPLVLWLKFGGPGGLTWWFWAKMALVVVALIGVGLHEWAGRRFRKGDESVVPLMFIGGRAAGIGILLAMLCAVFTFK